MIDFHNHILPNIDDGSKSLDISIDMIKKAQEQGITDIVNTVHFQHPKVEGENINLDRMEKVRDVLLNEMLKNNLSINIHLGAEVFYLPNLLSIADNPLTTFGSGKYMLIEFHPTNIPESHKTQLFDLKMKEITPIIAHPERYIAVQENINIVSDWLEAGCIIQLDAGSILGYLGKRARIASLEIIENEWCQLIGSDAHDNKSRNFFLKDAINMTSQLLQKDMSKLVNENPRKILDGEPISVDIKYNNLNISESKIHRFVRNITRRKSL